MAEAALFSELEIQTLGSQRLARIATVSGQGQVDVAPVGFQFDDLASVDPWQPRGVKIHGTAETSERAGRPVLVITPTRVWSWGLDGRPVIENGQFRVRRASRAA